jgi:3-dehydroquinate synthase
MRTIRQNFSVTFKYDVAFTEGVFNPGNKLFINQIETGENKPVPKVLFVFDEGMYKHHPELFNMILKYHQTYKSRFQLIESPVIIPGGEEAKNRYESVQRILDDIEKYDIDRHSYLAAIGGGAVIDTAGYAAGVAHRGVRLIRIPTTVLAQNDASVGVKNGINAYGKKNFLGTFTPPHAVLNDFDFLHTLEMRDWRSGISEAVKVALIKDESFFSQIEENVDRLADRDMEAMKNLIHRCAELHLEHIRTSGDPFETGSSRPLDFGHWSAHKLEQLSDYRLRHGEAVAIGIAVDSVYSNLIGMLSAEDLNRILDLVRKCGFDLYVPELEQNMQQPDIQDSVLHGLEEFREHLGGELTIMLLENIGRGLNVHEFDVSRYSEVVDILKSYEKEPV